MIRNWSAIGQLVTNIGVILGLLIVVYEVRETRVLTQAQLASDAWTLHAGTNAMVAGESLPETLARACFRPNELTEKDTVVLNAYFNNVWNPVTRLQYIEEFGFDTPIETLIQAQAATITATQAGIEWYKLQQFPDRVRLLADEVADDANGRLCASYLGALRSYQEGDEQ
jgi:hypothetical protein